MTRMHVYQLAIVGALLLGVGLSFVFLRDQVGEESEPGASYAAFDGPPSDSLEDVLRLTDLVLVATFEAERRAEVEQPPPGGVIPEGAALIRENLTLWTFAVDEVVIGDHAQPQAQVIFARSLGLPGPGDEYITVSWDVPELQKGESYVLFLSNFEPPDYYPEDWTGRSFGLAVAGVGEISGSSFLLEYADLEDLNGDGEKLTREGTLGSLPGAWESALAAAPTAVTGTAPNPEIRRRGAALERLLIAIDEQSLSAEEATALALAEGLDGERLGDAAFCFKVERAVLDIAGLELDLGCGQSAEIEG